MSKDERRSDDLENYRSLREPMVATGEWWIPGAHDRRVPGTFSFDPGADVSELALLGSFQKDAAQALGPSPPDAPPTINGLLFGGTLATVGRAVDLGTSFGGSRQARDRYHANLVLLGVHASDPYAVPITKCYVRFRDVERWMDLRAYSDEIKLLGKEPIERVLRRPWKRPALFEADLPRLGAAMRIEQCHTESFIMRSEVSARASVVFTLTYKSPTTVTPVLEAVHTLRLALFLLIGHPVPLDDVTVRVPEGDETGLVHVLFLSVDPVGAAYKKLDAHGATTNGAANAAACHSALVRFFDERAQMEPILETLLTAERTDAGRQRLLLHAQAVEVLHRTYFDRPRLPAAEYRRLRKQMLAALPGDVDRGVCEHLTRHLGHGNQMTLRERIVDLRDRLDPRLQVALGLEDERALEFARSMADTRNFLTHLSRRGRYALDGIELAHCSDLGRALTIVHLLLRLGFAPDAILEQLPKARVTEWVTARVRARRRLEKRSAGTAPEPSTSAPSE